MIVALLFCSRRVLFSGFDGNGELDDGGGVGGDLGWTEGAVGGSKLKLPKTKR
jgi:hypothetical protein